MEVNNHRVVFRAGHSDHAFSSRIVEDVSIFSRLISVLYHVVPSRGRENHGRNRCYFVDARRQSDKFLPNDLGQVGVKRKVLRDMRG